MPHTFHILGIGISKHKTNRTGNLEWTGISRHAKAELDPCPAMIDLLAHEIQMNSFRFIDILQTDVTDASDANDQQLWKSKVFFPNTDKTEDGQKGQIISLLKQVTKKIQGWDKDKRTGLFRKTAAGIANGARADADRVNRQMGWKGDTQSRSYALADLGAYVDVQAVLAGFDKDSWSSSPPLRKSCS